MSNQSSICRRYAFESAHFLPNVREGHKCKRMHGHNYEMEVTVEGPIQETGFVIDFWDLDALTKPWIEKVDHRVLNDIAGLENPTAEYIAEWFLERVSAEVKNFNPSLSVARVRIFETPKCYADATPSKAP